MRKLRPFLWVAIAATISLCAQKSNTQTINSVLIIGHHSFSQRKLLEQIQLKPGSFLLFSRVEFDRRLLKLDAISLKNYYHANGFLEVAVKDSFSVINDKVDIFFIIEEGKQYYLNSVSIIGLRSLKEKEVKSLLDLKTGSPYNPVQINTNQALLNEAFEEKGKLFYQFDIKQEVQDSVNITILINEGADVYIHHTWVSGLELIDSNYVRNEFSFKKGDLFEKNLMDKTKRSLLQSGFFSSVSLIAHPLANSDSLVNIEVRMKEFRNRGELELEPGYEIIEYVPGVNSLVGLGGACHWLDRMIFGSKNRFDARGSVVMPSEEGFVYPRFSV
ncbi:MAG: hypothetical protein MK228_03690, partial [Nitrososphaerales archaeon]|nr:hypothetical protein [Nitrososphaerales archaeon]